ncbi:MAG: hypothetical protein JSR58_06130 [Verrucomicrobia bacterium]|nr:hypothetical protein [Verrucomicrobiota bacterium]
MTTTVNDFEGFEIINPFSPLEQKHYNGALEDSVHPFGGKTSFLTSRIFEKDFAEVRPEQRKNIFNAYNLNYYEEEDLRTELPKYSSFTRSAQIGEEIEKIAGTVQAYSADLKQRNVRMTGENFTSLTTIEASYLSKAKEAASLDRTKKIAALCKHINEPEFAQVSPEKRRIIFRAYDFDGDQNFEEQDLINQLQQATDQIFTEATWSRIDEQVNSTKERVSWVFSYLDNLETERKMSGLRKVLGMQQQNTYKIAGIPSHFTVNEAVAQCHKRINEARKIETRIEVEIVISTFHVYNEELMGRHLRITGETQNLNKVEEQFLSKAKAVKDAPLAEKLVALCVHINEPEFAEVRPEKRKMIFRAYGFAPDQKFDRKLLIETLLPSADQILSNSVKTKIEEYTQARIEKAQFALWSLDDLEKDRIRLGIPDEILIEKTPIRSPTIVAVEEHPVPQAVTNAASLVSTSVESVFSSPFRLATWFTTVHKA